MSQPTLEQSASTPRLPPPPQPTAAGQGTLGVPPPFQPAPRIPGGIAWEIPGGGPPQMAPGVRTPGVVGTTASGAAAASSADHNTTFNPNNPPPLLNPGPANGPGPSQAHQGTEPSQEEGRVVADGAGGALHPGGTDNGRTPAPTDDDPFRRGLEELERQSAIRQQPASTPFDDAADEAAAGFLHRRNIQQQVPPTFQQPQIQGQATDHQVFVGGGEGAAAQPVAGASSATDGLLVRQMAELLIQQNAMLQSGVLYQNSFSNSAPNPRRSALKRPAGLQDFTGNTVGGASFLKFLSKFEKFCEASGVSGDERAVQIGTFLDGLALEFYEELPASVRGNYAMLRAALTKQFVSEEESGICFVAFKNREQGSNESVAEYALKLEELALGAFPGQSRSSYDQILKNQFIDGSIYKAQLQAAVGLKTYREVRDWAKKMEGQDPLAVARLQGHTTGPKVLAVSSPEQKAEPTEVAELKKLISDLSERLDSVCAMSEPSPGKNGQKSQQFSRQGARGRGNNSKRFRFTADGKPICVCCEKAGHVQRDCHCTKCRERKGKLGEASGNSRPPKRDQVSSISSGASSETKDEIRELKDHVLALQQMITSSLQSPAQSSHPHNTDLLNFSDSLNLIEMSDVLHIPVELDYSEIGEGGTASSPVSSAEKQLWEPSSPTESTVASAAGLRRPVEEEEEPLTALLTGQASVEREAAKGPLSLFLGEETPNKRTEKKKLNRHVRRRTTKNARKVAEILAREERRKAEEAAKNAALKEKEPEEVGEEPVINAEDGGGDAVGDDDDLLVTLKGNGGKIVKAGKTAGRRRRRKELEAKMEAEGAVEQVAVAPQPKAKASKKAAEHPAQMRIRKKKGGKTTTPASPEPTKRSGKKPVTAPTNAIKPARGKKEKKTEGAESAGAAIRKNGGKKKTGGRKNREGTPASRPPVYGSLHSPPGGKLFLALSILLCLMLCVNGAEAAMASCQKEKVHSCESAKGQSTNSWILTWLTDGMGVVGALKWAWPELCRLGRLVADVWAESFWPWLEHSVQYVCGSLPGFRALCPVKIEGIDTYGLLDTGATVTILDEQFAKKLKGVKWEPTSRTAQSASLHSLSFVAEGKVHLRFGGRALTHKVQVMKSAPHPVIMGTDFLSQLHVLTFDFASSRVILPGNNSVPLAGTHLEGRDKIRVSMAESLEIPARHEAVVFARVDGAVPHGSVLLVETPTRGLAKAHTWLARSVGTVTEGRLPVRLMNLQRYPIKLRKHETISFAQPLESAEIATLFLADGTGEKTHVSPRPANFDPVEKMDLSSPELTPEGKSKLAKLIRDNADVFSSGPFDLGRTTLVTHDIETGDHHPVRRRMYRVPQAQRESLFRHTEMMEKSGVIRRSDSPWQSPVLVIKKKDNTDRIVVDMRDLNKVCRPSLHPLPHLDDVLDVIGGSKWFSTLDLMSGYWQIPLTEQAKPKTAFSCCAGNFEFNVLPFGLTTAPACFQRLMELVLSGINWKSACVYIDDILVYTHGDFDQHLKDLNEVFTRLRKANLKLKPAKCSFARSSVPFLGHVISRDGCSPEQAKIEAIKNYPVPTNVRAVRAFLGLASYYRRFAGSNFAHVAAPLHKLTSKDSRWYWSKECQQSFENLKDLLARPPILAYPDFSKPFLLATDASDVGIGAVLSQLDAAGQERPIAYASRVLSKAERNYSTTQKEALAIYYFAKHFRPYLYGHKVTVLTDHMPLKYFDDLKDARGAVARWGVYLQEMDMEIKYKPGKTNSNADALSRAVPTVGDVVNALADLPFVPDLHEEQRKDPELAQLLAYLEREELPGDEREATQLRRKARDYGLRDGLLVHFPPTTVRPSKEYFDQLVLPCSQRQQALRAFHDDVVFGGHLGQNKTLDRVRQRFYWPGIESDVAEYCRQCKQCAERKDPPQKLRAPLSPIPVSSAFSRVAVDFMGPLKETRSNNKNIIVFTEYLTKWCIAVATPDQTARTTARIFLREVVLKHGCPTHLLSDRGSSFLNTTMTEMCKMLGTKQQFTSLTTHKRTD